MDIWTKCDFKWTNGPSRLQTNGLNETINGQIDQRCETLIGHLTKWDIKWTNVPNETTNGQNGPHVWL